MADDETTNPATLATLNALDRVIRMGGVTIATGSEALSAAEFSFYLGLHRQQQAQARARAIAKRKGK
jgi:hypothetical protein